MNYLSYRYVLYTGFSKFSFLRESLALFQLKMFLKLPNYYYNNYQYNVIKPSLIFYLDQLIS